MRSYALGRLASLLPVLIGVSLLAFSLANLAPGDPAEQALRQGGQEPTEAQIEALRRELGLDDPFPVRYVRWLGRAVQGDLGQSYADRRPVSQELARRFPATLELAVAAMGLALLVGITGGVVAAIFRDSLFDHACRGVSLVFASLPGFAISLVLVYVFAVQLHLLPVAGFGGGDPAHLILPAIALSAGPAATLLRLMRSSLLEIWGQDYVRTARANGLTEPRIVWVHALKNALLPVVTVAATSFGNMLGGAAIVEVIFAWPGIGKYVVDSIYARDYPVIQGFVLWAGVIFVAANLAADLLYRQLDPRVRLGARA
ncbi:MAG: nickel ABC transporter permease [Chloroflexota bacterium]